MVSLNVAFCCRGSGSELESDSSYQYTFTPKDLNELGKDRATRIRSLDRRKVKKMHTAMQLNQKLREWSSESQLVVLNLPRPPK